MGEVLGLSERMDDVTAGEFLQRIAQALKQHIGPAIEAEYPRTQAFMAAVVLQKLGRHLGLMSEHAAAEAAVGLGILIAFFRNKETVNADEIDLLKF